MSQRPRQKIRRDLNVPYYEQLKHLILQEIELKGLQPGDLLPSEVEFCQEYDVSRTVVRQAIGDLVNEGMLHRMRGKGTFVARPKLREQFMESTVGFFEDLTAQGHRVASEVLSLDLVEAGDRIAQALEVAVNAPVIELVRLRSVNDEVVTFTKSYVNSSSRELLADLRAADLTKTSLYRLLEDNWNLRIDSGQRSIEATKAKGMLATILELRAGEPVLFIESIGRDSAERPVEFFLAWHRADRTRLEMHVVRDNRRVTDDFTMSQR
jgi:GntR family transcriptional regulator